VRRWAVDTRLDVGSGLVTAWRLRAVRLPDGDVVDAGITSAGRWTLAPAATAEVLPGRFVLPGLVDAHCHLSVASGDDGLPVALDSAAARANLAQARFAGVTSIRDTGSPGGVTLELLPTADGEGLLACGRFLAPEGQYFPTLHAPVPATGLVSAALAEVAAGARWIKLIADFPVLRPGQPPTDPSPTYPMAEVERLVSAVHAAGARVAAHSTTRHVSELVAAGIDSVEHGTALAEADVIALAERGGAWTPTLCATIGGGPGDDPERQKRQLDRMERLRHLLPVAAARGVTIMTGSDVVGSVAREVALLADLGLAPQQALAAASTAARKFLGFTALGEGEIADLVSYDADPRDDPAVLAHPAAVFARGTRVR
jgi:imidazolonepropionase-like amidohydrolase